MIIAWIIGLLLSILGIWFLKNSRVREATWCGKVTRPEVPLLKVWSLTLLAISAIIPLLNIFSGVIMIIVWAVGVYGNGDWRFTKDDNKILRFINKPIQ